MGNRQEDILGVASALTDPARREESARALARLLGADAILLFISDPQLSTLLPAPGFPQTLPGGRAWKAFLRACEAGPAKTELTSPYTSAPTRVAGLRGADGSVLALLGGDPDAVAARTIIALLPLLAASFRGEQMAVVAEGHARVAQETAAKSRALAESLDAARRQLQQLNRAKDEFLAMLSHELRNPLGAISNATRLLEDQIPENIAARRPLGIVRRQIGHMTQLVNDLMDVARITQGKIVLQKKSVALDALVASAVNSLAPHFHAKGLSVRLEAGPETYVCADAVRLEQIVTNLLTNALKYTESGTIAVSVVREGDAAAFRVSDTGIGIAPELLPSIFDLFTQEERSLARSEGGLGIGLSLVKGLVEIHGGTIAAESAGAGHGSTFTVRLPALQKAPPEEADPAEENPPGQRRILVVDDNADAAETLVDVLGAWGHIAEAVHDGEAALLKVAAVRPDIVLLDLGLPGIDGYEVARRLRSDPSLNDVLLVALTGYGHEEDRRRTRYVGFDYHFVKPMDFAALRRLVADPRASLPDGD